MFEIQDYIDQRLTHSIHTSERRAFRACRRRWDWAHRQGYHPIVSIPPLEFGIAFHKAMEKYYEPMSWTMDNDIKGNLALVAFRQECEAQLRKYKRLNPDPDVAVLDDYQARIELGLGMLRHYCWNVAPRYDLDWTPIRVEVPFEVPVLKPGDPTHCAREQCDVCEDRQMWCTCEQCWNKWIGSTRYPKDFDEWKTRLLSDTTYVPEPSDHGYVQMYRNIWKGLPVTYGGRLDALMEDKHGRYWVVDWKTTSRILDEDAEASFLQLDDQVSSYVWSLSQYGIAVAGFVYVEFKKSFPHTPKPLIKIHSGRSYSVSKQELVTFDEFENAIIKNDNDAWQMGLYDDYLNWLKLEGPVFTQRHQIHKNAHEITEVGRNIALEALDIIGNPRVYPQPGRFSCQWCLYKQPCLGVNMGEDYQYTLDTMFERSDKKYYEKEPSTE